jgi:hypothetical protein
MTLLLSVDMFLAQSVIGTDHTLSALGAGWGALDTEVLPVRISRVGVGVILAIGPNAQVGQHHVDLRLENAFGVQLELGSAPEGPRGPGSGRIPADLWIDTMPPAYGATPRNVCFAFNLENLMVREYGVHRIVLALDGVDVKATEFVVRRPLAPQ